MKGKNFVVINGRHYDAVTGVAISDTIVAAKNNAHQARAFHDIGPAPVKPALKTAVATPAPVKPAVNRPGASASHSIHRKPQKSQTLHRAAIKKPAISAPQSTAAANRSPLITKFGPNNSHIKPVAAAKTQQQTRPASTVKVTAPAAAPIHTPAKHVKAATALAPVHSSRLLKEQLIKEKLAHVEHKTKEHRNEHPLKRLARRQPKFATIATMSLATIMLGGYLTYINMPNLSVRVASARAGVDAQFPEYQPDGYNFAGPVAYAPGEVTLKFDSNGGSQGYEIKQRASNWDSQAVLDNYISRESSSYLTYSEQGLTVYTYGNKAAWVNGGVLYTIKGDASLSSDQILRIAGSM